MMRNIFFCRECTVVIPTYKAQEDNPVCDNCGNPIGSAENRILGSFADEDAAVMLGENG